MTPSATGPTAAAPDPSGAAEPGEAAAAAAEQGTSEQDAVPLNRAERRARAKAEATGRTGPPPDRTLRRGRGPRSHTKRV